MPIRSSTVVSQQLFAKSHSHVTTGHIF